MHDFIFDLLSNDFFVPVELLPKVFIPQQHFVVISAI